MICQHFDILWNGPYEWPQPRLKSPLDDLRGVYLWTVESGDGYVVSGCGITERAVRKRVNEHRRGYLQGKYTLLDIDAMRDGIRKEIWHGMWAGHDSDERKEEFERRRKELEEFARAQMAAFRIFVAPVTDKRIQERIEAAIVQSLYEAPEPFCDLPDRGTHMMPRRENETPLVFRNRCRHRFKNFPETMES